MDLNAQITSFDATQQIDFKKASQPHVTLYMTSFLESNIDALSKRFDTLVLQLIKLNFNRINATIASWKNAMINGVPVLPCVSTALAKPDVSGTYGMWPVERNACVQFLSDSLANNTFEFVEPSAFTTIPPYVLNYF